MPKIILATIITVIVLAVAVFGINFLIANKNIFPISQATSPNILYITNPVFTFSGTIDAVRGNTITVSQEMTFIQLQPATSNPNQAPAKPQTKKITYSILLNDKTMINQSPETIPYSFKQAPVGTISAIPANNLSVGDLKTGQTVSVNSNTDLRTLIGNQFTATLVNISSKIFLISGKITKINGNEITVSGTASLTNIFSTNPQIPKEKEYTTTANQDTEISGMNISADISKSSQSIRYSISDLKNDMQVTVYTKDDPDNNNKVNALLIKSFIIPSQTIIVTSPTATASSQKASPIPQNSK